MAKITFKIAKNGTRIFYADSKRVSYRKAEEIDTLNRYQSICTVLDSRFPTAETTPIKNSDYNPRANDGTFKLVAWVLMSSSNLYVFPSGEIRFTRGYKNAVDAVNALEYLKEHFGVNFKGGHVLPDKADDITHFYSIVRRLGGYIVKNTLI